MKRILLLVLAVFLYTGVNAADKKEKAVKENKVELTQLTSLLAPTKLNVVKSVKVVFGGTVCTKFEYRPNGATWVTEVYTVGGQVRYRVYDTYQNPNHYPHTDQEITVVQAIKMCGGIK